jgi:cytochrome c oxidase subunit 1
MSEKLGKLHFWMTFIGMNGTFLPMHWLGLQGMPRRYATYETFAHAYPGAQLWNDVATFSSFIMALALPLVFFNMLWSLKYGKRAGNNPWGARTLEWMIASPPPYYNFKHIPVVLGLPYDFSEPLPYQNLDHKTDPYPVPIPAALSSRSLPAGAGV